jgi:hypothetical protein
VNGRRVILLAEFPAATCSTGYAADGGRKSEIGGPEMIPGDRGKVGSGWMALPQWMPGREVRGKLA